MASPMLKTGDPCPCCGQPIKATDPAILAVLTHIRDAPFNVSDYKKYMEDMMRHASGRNST